MKKFGTPRLGAPRRASENVGLLFAGGCAWLSGTGVAVGDGVGVATLPVSDSVLTAPPVVWLAGLGLVLVGVLPTFERGFGVAGAGGFVDGVAVGVGCTVPATVGAAVGVGVESVEPRSTIE